MHHGIPAAGDGAAGRSGGTAGGDEFALWLDGADEFAAAERAESLRIEGPKALAHLSGERALQLTMSIGIATRWPGQGEEIESQINRADQAMYEVKRAGRGHWLVSRTRPPGQGYNEPGADDA